MALVSCQNLGIAFGGRPLLNGATLQIERGERIGLVGRNGEGKSTLLKIVAGEILPDAGQVILESGVRVTSLSQIIPDDIQGTVAGVIAGGLSRVGMSGAPEEDHRVARMASLLDVELSAPFAELSGGQKRRTLLGRALVEEPDVLLLDEPTNHLDLAGIEWIENFLTRFNGSLLFVTHDRSFLQRLATRIVELDRGKMTSWACDYPTYLRRKEELLASEEKEWAEFDRRLAEEEVWIRRGIKARRTRNEGRVRALEAMRRDRADRRDRVGTVRLDIHEAGTSGKRVIRAEGIGFRWEGEPIVRDFSTEIVRGDKVGVVGPNGAGKTTLLNLLLGKLEPESGTVTHGTALQVAYFDQHREQLDPMQTVVDAVGNGGDHVEMNGERRHVMSYLQDFLFSPERARQPIRVLSGGERNRLLLARLFTSPANLLVLDEPTNDLDTETLELLEARLVDFGGTVLVVSHDRTFLDNLCTSTLVFEDRGHVHEYVGGYSDWQRVIKRRREEAQVQAPEASKPKAPRASAQETRSDRPEKLSFNEKRELTALPSGIDELEKELEKHHQKMSDPEFYRGAPDDIRAATERTTDLEALIEQKMERWAELSEREA